MAGYNKDDVRKDTTGQGKKRSVKITGYGKDKVKKVYKKGKLVKSKTGTLITKAQEKAKEFFGNQKEVYDAKTKAKDAKAKANQSSTKANMAKAEEAQSGKIIKTVKLTSFRRNKL